MNEKFENTNSLQIHQIELIRRKMTSRFLHFSHTRGETRGTRRRSQMEASSTKLETPLMERQSTAAVLCSDSVETELTQPRSKLSRVSSVRAFPRLLRPHPRYFTRCNALLYISATSTICDSSGNSSNIRSRPPTLFLLRPVDVVTWGNSPLSLLDYIQRLIAR